MAGSRGWSLPAGGRGAGESAVRCPKMVDGLLRNGSAGPDPPTNHRSKGETDQIWVQNATETRETF
jgi:hypothetical protein